MPADLPPDWVHGIDVLTDNPADPVPIARLEEVDTVVTGCAIGIAATGTIVLDAGPAQGRPAEADNVGLKFLTDDGGPLGARALLSSGAIAATAVRAIPVKLSLRVLSCGPTTTNWPNCGEGRAQRRAVPSCNSERGDSGSCSATNRRGEAGHPAHPMRLGTWHRRFRRSPNLSATV